MRHPARAALITIAIAVFALAAHGSAAAQSPDAFGTCVPVSQRAGRDVGCFIVTEQKIGPLGPAPVFWHVTRFASRAAAEAANHDSSTVLEAFDAAWSLKISNASWRPKRGHHVATIGPLPISPGTSYSALYMEATMRPGMKSAIHRHSGPEAWYTLQGETCLETPTGTQVGRAGGPPVIVPGGGAMELTATGTVLRKSLVLILHDSSQPPTRIDSTWTPRGACTRTGR